MKYYSRCIILCILSFLLMGCGTEKIQEVKDSVSNNEIVSQIKDAPISKNEADPIFQDLDLSTVVDPTTLTYDQFMELSLDEIKKIVCVYTDDFRTTYNIQPNVEITDEDWNKIKFLLFYQIFGKDGLTYYQDTNKIDTIEEVYETISANEIYDMLSDEDLIYLEPTPEYLSSLTVSEFRTWLEKANVYYSETEEELDLSSVPDDEIQKIQEKYILELQNINP